LFSDDAIVESDLSYLIGPAAINAMVYGEGHQSLIQQGSGWRVTKRTNHVIDGEPEASQILRRLFEK
jgi:hypothetical protein